MRMSSSSWLPISSTTGVFRPMPGVAFRWSELLGGQEDRATNGDSHHDNCHNERPNISAAFVRQFREPGVDRREPGVDRRELLLDLRELLSELFAELRELDVHLGVESDESRLGLDLEVCQVTFRGQLLPSSRWLLCHKELRNDRDRGEVAYEHHSIIKAIQKY